MAHFEDDMDKPVTKRELREVLNVTFDERLKPYPTKQDLEPFATRQDLEPFATKQDLEPFATKQDLEPFATKQDLEPLATKQHLSEQLQLVVDMFVDRMGKMLRDQEDRIAAAIWPALEMYIGSAVGALEDKLVPRIMRLEDKVFPPKRQRRR